MENQNKNNWNAEEHAVWLNERQQIASFHAEEGYVRRTLASHEQFLRFLQNLLDTGYRFQ